jgi:hypothetical protein
VAWSNQGRHHCLRGGEEPPGLLGPVEGQGKREAAGRGQGGWEESPLWEQGSRGRDDRNRHGIPPVTKCALW